MKYLNVTIQMKTTKQCFLVVLFIRSYKVVLTFESVDEIRKHDITLNATKQHFHSVPFVFASLVFLLNRFCCFSYARSACTDISKTLAVCFSLHF